MTFVQWGLIVNGLGVAMIAASNHLGTNLTWDGAAHSSPTWKRVNLAGWLALIAGFTLQFAGSSR